MSRLETLRHSGRAVVELLPASILVGPFEISIERMDSHRSAVQGAFGEFRCAEQMITIQAEMPTGVKAVDTLIHEVNHAIWWAYNVYDEDKEERTVATLATAWVQVYRDNPWLLSWIDNALHGEPA